jgi:hypothetical protein
MVTYGSLPGTATEIREYARDLNHRLEAEAAL